MSKIISVVEHRPFPLPSEPFVMAQSWRDLLFAHWPVSPKEVEPFVPPGLTIDTFDGDAWIGLVPLRMCEVHPNWFPSLPWISYFLELNLRTYVRRNDKSGVYFFSLDCSNPLAVRFAREFFHLPYFDAGMSFNRKDEIITFKSERRHGKEPKLKLHCSYRPVAPVVASTRGSLEAFLTERYCLFTSDKKGEIYCGNVHHVQWPLQVAEGEFRCNEMGSPFGWDLSANPLLHYSANLDTIEWSLNKV